MVQDVGWNSCARLAADSACPACDAARHLVHPGCPDPIHRCATCPFFPQDSLDGQLNKDVMSSLESLI